VKVRIKETPREEEIDGVRLNNMKAGSIREVSPSIGSWLVAERYAVPEMRHDVRNEADDFCRPKDAPTISNDSPRRRSSDE
jgi:hypothetical protein